MVFATTEAHSPRGRPSKADRRPRTAVGGPNTVQSAEKAKPTNSRWMMVTAVAVIVLAMVVGTQGSWSQPHALPLLKYRQKRAPLQAVNSGSIVYAIDSGRIYKFDFSGDVNPTFAIDIAPSKLDPCQSVQLQIADGGCSGDTYAVFLDGEELGRTSLTRTQTCSLRMANGTTIDMTDPAQATTLLFPGLVWNPAWSSGRFNIVPGQHILEIRMVNKGDGTGGTLVMSALEHQCSISPRSTNSTPLYMGTMLIDREPHVFFPSAPTEWIVNVPNNSSCLDLTVIDAVCGGDRWNVELDGAPYGNSSAVSPITNCSFPNLNEGEGSVEWFDLFRPPVPNSVHSRYRLRVTTAGNHTLRFDPLWGPGSDGRFAYYFGVYGSCGSATMGPATPWIESKGAAPATTFGYSSTFRFVTATRAPGTSTATPTTSAQHASTTSLAPATATGTTTTRPSSAGKRVVQGGIVAAALSILGLAL